MITGGAGFVGSNLANTLDQLGYNVLVVDSMKNGSAKDLKGKVQYLVKDLTKFDLRLVNFDADVVFHLVCTGLVESIMYPKLDLATNAGTMLNVLEYAKEKGSMVIYTSSGAVHGLVEREDLPLHEGSKINPNNFYGMTKFVAEEYCRLFFEEHGVKSLATRLWNVYGYPQRINHEINWIPVVTAFLVQDQPVIFGSGDQTRDFTYVLDVVDGLIKAMEYLKTAETFEVINLNGGAECSIKELYEIAMETRNEDKPAVHGDPSLGDVPFLLADNTKARTLLDWKPRGIREGIADYWQILDGVDKSTLTKE